MLLYLCNVQHNCYCIHAMCRTTVTAIIVEKMFCMQPRVGHTASSHGVCGLNSVHACADEVEGTLVMALLMTLVDSVCTA